jgi:hypothetical protein
MKPASTSNEAAWDAHSSDDQVKPKSSDDQGALFEIENGLRRDIDLLQRVPSPSGPSRGALALES